MLVKMQSSSTSSSGTDFQRLRERWTTLLNRIYEDPRVAQLMNTRIGQYLSSHPFIALTVLLFSAMAALPVGLFITFALVTLIMSGLGFVFFEVFLLSVGGMTLLCVLSGIAIFSFMVSLILEALHITISKILKLYYPHLTKRGQVQEKESEGETSKPKEME
ncbi:lipid droplet assembly factor 1-like [Micropterus dolomieu]|uniref:lipid droplet assembly factor 1-like n=1 Tax=Micropterus dolomieu TaxID=147949 RepID=UPI001E8CBA78|nr:lipid droplet assembly factor 1-like [Micropterus dolomieu]